MKHSLSLLLSLAVGLVGSTVQFSPTLAQVTTDGTTSTTVNADENNFDIKDGDRSGSNLFHSFQDFSVPNGGSAFFDNNPDIANIFSRVTGGNISNIDGLIRANGSANLFLINPAGIIFGEGASLDVGGSFYGSTADSILFPDDVEFSATDIQSEPVLTINAPIGLGFRDNPGDIVNSSVGGLGVSSEKTLALVGGNVSFDGGAAGFDFVNNSSSGAIVELGGLTAAGTVEIGENGRLGFPANTARGDVSLSNGSILNVISPSDGAVFINAKNFEMTTDSLILNATLAESDSTIVRSGDIVINATEDVLIDGSNSSQVSIGNNVFTSSPGEAGKIEISAKNISLVNGGFITSLVANTNQGRSSDVTLTARENITLQGINNFLQSGVSNQIIRGAEGNGGEINIAAQNLTISEGAAISSTVTGVGNSSNINIDVKDTVAIDAGSEFFTQSQNDVGTSIGFSGEGNSGNINLKTRELSLINGGNIASETFGEGISGNIDITAETIFIDGELSEITSETSTDLIDFSNDETTQSSGGNLNIITDSLSITNGGELSASTYSIGDAGNIKIVARDSILVDGKPEGQFEEPSIIKSDVQSVFLSDIIGNSGNIEIDTPKLSVTNGAIISASTFSDGNAGNLIIRTSDSLEVSNNAVIQAEVFQGAEGTGGNLTIETAKLSVSEGAQISASTRGNGNAGNLTIRATDSVEITGETETGKSGLLATALLTDGTGGELKIFTQDLNVTDGAIISVGNFPTLEGLVEPGTGEPGNLEIQANSITLDNKASISAATQSLTGSGANITLLANNIFLRDNSLISARAFQDANGGNLTIDTDFIVAFPNGNSDIVANAQQGNGGNINITAESLFGIAQRPLNPITNDINASSDFGLDGSISINIPDVNALQRDTELPRNLVETEETVAQACRSDRVSGKVNGLNIKGKGGVPPEPTAPMDSDAILVDGEIINLHPQIQSQNIKPIATSIGNIYPAKGVITTELGETILTAYPTNGFDLRTPHIKANCIY